MAGQFLGTTVTEKPLHKKGRILVGVEVSEDIYHDDDMMSAGSCMLGLFT